MAGIFTLDSLKIKIKAVVNLKKNYYLYRRIFGSSLQVKYFTSH